MAPTVSDHGVCGLVAGGVLEALRRDPRRAISEDGVVCLVCGEVSHAVCRRHADKAIRRGLAQMIRRRPIVADPTLRARGGARMRARQESLSRRQSGRRYRTLPSRDASGRFVTASAATAGVS